MLKLWKFTLFFLLCLVIALLFNLPIQQVLPYVKLPNTVRAIGMQRADVRWSFMAEVLLLTMIACVVGLVVGLLVIQILGMVSVEAEGILVLLLVDNHLYFVPTLGDVVKNLLIIVGIALITAYFPAQRAAKLSVAEALRHYE